MTAESQEFEHPRKGGLPVPDFLAGGGEMGALMRAKDWSDSSLGSPASWPQPLRTVVRLMLNSGHPMYIWWGRDGACLYNDAYRESIGPERHPGSLGKPAREVWDEIWHIIGPQIEQVMSGGGATWNVNQLVPITRHGRREDVYWTYSYSPIDDHASPGGIGGVLVICTETTQQILLTRELTEQRDQLAQLFEQAPVFMALLRGPEHRIEIANPGYLRLVGDRQVLGKTVAEMLQDANDQGYLVLLDQVFSSGKAYAANGAIYNVQPTSGGPVVERFIDFAFQPIKDGDGRVTGIFVQGADVTDYIRTDAALRRSDARLRLLDNLSQTIRLAVDPRSIMRSTTRLLGEHLGVMRCAYADVEPNQDQFTIRDDWSAAGVASSVGAYSLAAFGPLALASLRGGETLVLDDIGQQLEPARGGDTFGSLQIRAIVVCPLIKADGLRGMMAVHAATPREWSADEISLVEAVAERSWAHLERVRAEALQRANEARLTDLIDTMPSLIWTADAQGELLWVSRWLHLYTGRPADRFFNRYWPEFFHPDDLPNLLERWSQALATSTPYRCMCRVLRADGAWRWLMLLADPVLDGESRVHSWCGSGTDVNDFKEASDSLEQSEARFREIASQLSDANRLKDEFLATLAHELRNPLAPIRNALELMKRAPDNASIAVSARQIMERQLLQMVRLIDDLLDLSRVSRGIVELRRTRMPLAAALRDAIETSRPLIEQSGHALTVSIPQQPIELLADPTRIVQIFANLMNNAAKFTPRGGHIELSLRQDAARSVAIVSVRDNGVGISTTMLERVFDMFTQVDRSHAHIGGGLGIGLTLVRRLVEMHGGSVEARSAGAGSGSEFLVHLPVASPIALAADRDEAAAESQSPQTKPLRIIVADDNVDAARSLSLVLELLGHETRVAHDGAEALALARELQPDVMVLDVAMPLLDGHEVARSIRSEPWGAEVLLIAASGWGQAEDQQLSSKAGFNHHLVKPLELAVLEKLLGDRAADDNVGSVDAKP